LSVVNVLIHLASDHVICQEAGEYIHPLCVLGRHSHPRHL